MHVSGVLNSWLTNDRIFDFFELWSFNNFIKALWLTSLNIITNNGFVRWNALKTLRSKHYFFYCVFKFVTKISLSCT